MKRWACLFITVLLLAALAPVDPPQKVSFRLADGVRISGEMTARDEQGIDGSFGRRDWLDLHPDDVWAVYRKAMERNSAPQWIQLGRLMLILPDQNPRAQRAFSEALKIDKEAQPRIDQVQAEAAAIVLKRKQEAAKGKPGVLSPEAGPFDPAPWPPRTDKERAEATLALRGKSEAMLKAAGATGYEVIESDFFLVFTDVPRLQAAQWGWTLDQAAKRLHALLWLPRDTRLFDSKAAVFIFERRDIFAALENDAFKQVVPEKLWAITHYFDDGIFINFHRGADRDEAELTDALARHATLAALHRHHSALRLPAWANEGLAAYVASQVQPKSLPSMNRHRDGLKFIRDGRRLDAIVAAEYSHDAFLNEQPTIQAVGELIVDLMIRERSEEFAAWVLAVKSGKSWPLALTEDFGLAPAKLFNQAAAHYTVND